MSCQVLVPIHGRDRIEELLPYLEVIARADMKIVFLVHFGTNRFGELAGQLLEIQRSNSIFGYMFGSQTHLKS